MQPSRKMRYLEEIDRIAAERKRRSIQAWLTSLVFIVMGAIVIAQFLINLASK